MRVRYKYFRRKQVWVFFGDKMSENVQKCARFIPENRTPVLITFKKWRYSGINSEIRDFSKKHHFGEKRTTPFWEDVLTTSVQNRPKGPIVRFPILFKRFIFFIFCENIKKLILWFDCRATTPATTGIHVILPN